MACPSCSGCKTNRGVEGSTCVRPAALHGDDVIQLSFFVDLGLAERIGTPPSLLLHEQRLDPRKQLPRSAPIMGNGFALLSKDGV